MSPFLMVTGVDPSYLTSNNNNRESKMAEDNNSIPTDSEIYAMWMAFITRYPDPTDKDMEAEFTARDLTTEEVWYASTGCINKCLGCGELDVSGDIEWRNHECPGRDMPIETDEEIPF